MADSAGSVKQGCVWCRSATASLRAATGNPAAVAVCMAEREAWDRYKTVLDA